MTGIRQRLPIIASHIIGSYDEPGGCNHPDGLNLPSPEHVISILQNLLRLCFPGELETDPQTECHVFRRHHGQCGVHPAS